MKPSSVSNLCRTCLKQNGSLKSIFTIYEGSKFLNTFADIINVYITSLVNITKGDGFPDMICPSCSQKVLEFYEFKTNIENNEQILKSQSPIINFWVKEEKLDSDENFQESDVNCDKTDDSISTLAEATMVDVNKGDECAIKQEKENEEKNEYKIVNVEDLTNNFQDNLNKIIKNGQDSLVMQEMLNHEVKIEDLEENECEMLSIDNTRTSLESDEDDPMQEDVNEEIELIPAEIEEAAYKSTLDLKPTKSKQQYEIAYNRFMEWCKSENLSGKYNEKVFLTYFEERSKKWKSSTMWSNYSMIKMMINIKKNLDISKYRKLIAFLKGKSKGYRPIKSKILTHQQIKSFLKDAPDEKYLMIKVATIIAIFGACRREELCVMTVDNIEDLGDSLVVTIPDTKTKTPRVFSIDETCYINLYRKYINLRPAFVNHQRLFIQYIHQKCNKSPVGINTFGKMPSLIAEFLSLSDPHLFTGHCFRRSSASILADANASTTTIKIFNLKSMIDTTVAVKNSLGN